MRTRLLVRLALLTALSIALTRFASVLLVLGGLPTIRLSFGEIPIMLAGLLFGPVAGGTVGVAADLLGIAIMPPPNIFPGFTLSSALVGILPPLFFRLFPARWGEDRFARTLWAVAATDIVVSLGLNTLWLSIIFNKGMLALLPARILARALLVPTYALTIYAVRRAYQAVWGVAAAPTRG